MDLILSQPRGFCAGVVRAIEIVERALEIHGPPVYVLHEIVHNRHVVEDLGAKGARFVEEIDEIPEGSITIFSAHGVARRMTDLARERSLRVIDATCPLVTKVHAQARRYQQGGRELIIIGHPGHPEVEGHKGQVDGPVHVVATVEEAEALELADPTKAAYVTQTTLSIDDTKDIIAVLERRCPGIAGPSLDDICYATQNRQNAVAELSSDVDVVVVVGAPNSSNSNRLVEVAELRGVRGHLVEDESSIDPAWFEGARAVGVTAGASAPEHLVQRVVEALERLGVTNVREMEGEPEDTIFHLPRDEQFHVFGS